MITSSLVGEPARSPFLTTLIGRERELDDLLALLDQGHRLITICGPGGVGKTTLAEHLAATLSDEFQRDVLMVPLSAITRPDGVLQALAHALGIGDAHVSLRDACRAWLLERSPLVVLDNMEHVLAAAPEVTSLILDTPATTLVITSRVPLRVEGEQSYHLAPLTFPGTGTDTDVIARSPAVQLFVERSRTVRPTFVLTPDTARDVAAICRRLDGLPLAVELAAARISILSPASLLKRLENHLDVLGSERRDIPERQRTLRNVVAWSYRLLSPEDQRLFRRISLPPGEISLDAVEAIVDIDSSELRQRLDSLVDQALLLGYTDDNAAPRYRLLHTVRDVGREQLAASGEIESVRRAFLDWAVALAETAESGLLGPDRNQWVNRLETEWPNLRAAVEWATEENEHDLALRILVSTWRFVSTTGRVVESRAALIRALAGAGDTVTPLRVKARIACANLSRDDHEAARHFTAALEGARLLGDPLQICSAEFGLAKIHMSRGEHAAALQMLEQALVNAERSGNRMYVVVIQGTFGNLHYYNGDLVAAKEAMERCLAEHQAQGNVDESLIVMANLGALMIEMQDYRGARHHLTQVVERNRELGNLSNLAHALVILGKAEFRSGEVERSNRLIEEGLALAKLQDDPAGWAELAAVHVGTLSQQCRYQDAGRLAAECILGVEQNGDPSTLANLVIHVANICRALGRPDDAVRLLYGARANLGEAVLLPDEEEQFDQVMAGLPALVSPAAWNEQERAGLAMTYEDLAHDALLLARTLANVEAPPEPVAITPVAQNPLTKREQEVLRHLASGASSRTIGDALFISPRTASTHVENILRKLETNSRAAAVALALRNGWV